MNNFMTKNEKIWFGLAIVVLAICFWAIFYYPDKGVETAKSIKLDTCIKYSQVAIPDANDTQGRADFIKNCYE